MSERDDFATHRIDTTARCPTCGRLQDGATAAVKGQVGSPAPGDVTVCAYCATLLMYTEGFGVRELGPDDVNVLPPETRDALTDVRWLILNRPFPLRGSK